MRAVTLGSKALFTGVLAVGLAITSAASAKRRVGFPCAGCVLDPPPADAAAPLVVVLHGDAGGGSPDVHGAADVFAKEAAKRGIAVFAPRCPTDKGCAEGSWWQWEGGDPTQWLESQVKAIEATYAIDPDRIFLAGWSGGASYLGWWAGALGGRYAAVAHLGGGIPPRDKACPRCNLPALFVVGDANPLHHLAVGLRDRYLACGADVRWDLHPKANHAGEWSAVHATAAPATILDWLLAHPRHCPLPTAMLAPASLVPLASSSSTRVEPPLSRAPPPQALTHCGCHAVGAPGNEGGLVVLAMYLVACRRRR